MDHPGQNQRNEKNSNILSKGATLQGRYEVVKVLGLGGMGSVYQARDLRFSSTKRLCALKEMISTTPDPNLQEIAVHNFEREANLLARLSHPAIPQIYDYFTEGVRNYLVLEYIAGMDLEAVLKSTQSPMPEDRVIDWAVQICEVLSYLHNQKPPIIFRDLKPSNIMIRPPNEIVLVDFGIARIFRAELKGTMVGTEGYAPPEQYRGAADPQVDIYALGATLHHLLTRRDPRLQPPFTFLEESLRSLNPRISRVTEAVIQKSLAYRPEDRFETADEMKQALVSCMAESDSQPEIDEDIEDQVPTGRFDSGDVQKPTIQLGGNAPFTAGNQGVQPVWTYQCDDEVRSSPVVTDDVVFVGSYDAHLHALDAHSGELRWRYATEGGIAATPCVWKDRVLVGSEDRFLYAVSSQAGRILWTCPTDGCVRSSVTVEIEHAFFGSDDHRLYAVNALTGREVWSFEALGPIRSSPAVGEEMVYVGCDDHHLYAVDLKSGSQRWKFRANRGITSSPALHKGLVIFGSSDWNVYALDQRTGYSAWRFRTQQMVLGSPQVANGVVYVGSVDGCVYSLDAATGRQNWKFNTGSQIVSRPAISENSLYFGTGQGELISLSCGNGKERWRFDVGAPLPSSPCVANGIVYIGANDCRLYAFPA